MSRLYRQYCGLARALDVVGERWTLLIVRELLLGPKRYGDLLESLPGLTTNLLAKRLRDLADEGLIETRKLPKPAGVTVYALTDGGRALEPAVMELARWGGRYMGKPDPGDRVDIGWGLLSLKRRYKGALDFAVELRVGERVFAMEPEPGYLRVEERPAAAPRLVVSASSTALREVFFLGPPTYARATAAGISHTGTPDDAARFFGAFEAKRS